jgi:hypothetical protein
MPLIDHFRCLAHCINLATQAVISAHSKSPHYDPQQPDDHIPDTDALKRDAVGLIRAICVKVSSFVYLLQVLRVPSRNGPQPNGRRSIKHSSCRMRSSILQHYCSIWLFVGHLHILCLIGPIATERCVFSFRTVSNSDSCSSMSTASCLKSLTSRRIIQNL